MFNFLSLYYVIFTLNVLLTNSQISDKRRCANEDCTAPISYAKTVIRYGSQDKRILSFAQNVKVTIYSKSAGTRENLWGAEIEGKRGYIPKEFVRETEIVTKDYPYLVDTEEPSQVPVKEKLVVDSVQQPYEVVDGTTFFSNTDATIEPTSTQNTIKATANIQDLNNPKALPLKLDELNNIESAVTVEEPTTRQDNFDEKLGGSDDIKKAADDKNLHSDGSIVNNVLSSFSNWMNEAVEIQGIKEDTSLNPKEETDDDAEEYDSEVEDDDEDENEDDDEYDSINEPEETHIEISEDQKKSETRETLKIPTSENVYAAGIISELNKLEGTIDKESVNNNEPHQSVTDETEVYDKFSKDEQYTIEIPILELPKPFQTTIQDVTPNPQEDSISETNNVINDQNNLNTIASNNDNQNNSEEAIKETNANDENNININQESIEIQNTEQSQEILNELNTDLHIIDGKGTVYAKTIISEQEVIQLNNVDKPIENKLHVEENVLNLANDTLSHKQLINENDESEIKINVTEQADEVFKTQQPEENLESSWMPISTDQNHYENVLLSEKPVDHQNYINSQKEFRVESEPIKKNILKAPNSVEEDSIEQNNQDVIEQDLKEISSQQTVEQVKTNFDDSVVVNQNDTDLKEQIFNTEYANLEDKTFSEDSKSTEVITENQNSEVISSMFGNLNTESSDVNNIIEEQLDSNKDTNELISNFEENTESNSDIKNPTTEPSARDILWGSTIRKDLEDKVEKPLSEYDIEKHSHDFNTLLSKQTDDELSCGANPSHSNCVVDHEHLPEQDNTETTTESMFSLDFFPETYELYAVLIITAVSVIVFLWGYVFIDKNRKEKPLIAKVNELQRQLLIRNKEYELIREKLFQSEGNINDEEIRISNEVVQKLQAQLDETLLNKSSLEDQIRGLEKELENSTEVGLELNRMLSEFLNSENGSDTLVANIEQLQRQLVEQQGIINTYNENLITKETENHELRLELDINNTKVTDLQDQLNKMALNLLKVEEDKDTLQNTYENDIVLLKEQIEKNYKSFQDERNKLSGELTNLQDKYETVKRDLDIKTNEYMLLKENIKNIEKLQDNNENLKTLFDISSIKAESLHLKNEKELLLERLHNEMDLRSKFEQQRQLANEEMINMKLKYEQADQQKLEAQTKLEILSNYFKKKEAQLQKELNKQEAMWMEQQGEATSTTERIKYMQKELQNYKMQYESLKQEIVAQEVELKSQISVLEKKSHESWVAARQSERKLEDAKQEAAQLRNALTLRERISNDDKMQNRYQSTLEQNGESPLSPIHMTNDSAISLPLIYGTTDHLTTSPQLPGLPPFLPPPPGVPFMPPPLGGVHILPLGFMPPPPSMLSGDHRPPPLGRMSSPPLNSRYSPDTRAYSPFSRNSPSPTSDDDYDQIPVQHSAYRTYSPYSQGDERREFNRPLPPSLHSNLRNNKGGAHSSGSANSNESLEKINRHNSKV